MLNNDDLLSKFKFFGIICRCLAFGPYITKNNKNNTYEQSNSLREKLLLFFILIFVLVSKILLISQMITLFKESLLYVNLIRCILLGICISTDCFLLLAYKNRKLNYKIFARLNKLFMETKTSEIKNIFIDFNIFVFTVCFLLTLVFLVWFIRGVFLHRFFCCYIVFIFPAVHDCQIILVIFLAHRILYIVNQRLKDNKCMLKGIITYHSEIFEICKLINASFHDFILRIIIMFLAIVSWAFDILNTMVEHKNNAEHRMAEYLNGLIWITSSFAGIIILLFYCDLLKYQVRSNQCF